MKIHRKEYIMSELEKKSYVKVTDLQTALGVTEMTIRRDLKELEQEGLLIRIHGGAQKINNEDENGIKPTPYYFTLEHEERKMINTDKKNIIAKKAASLIRDDEVIFISASTTNELIAQYFTAKNVKIVTNCLYIFFQYYKNPNVEAILLGGKYNEFIQSFLGTITLHSIETLSFSKAFIGTNGITFNQLYASNDEEGLLHKQVLDKAKERYIVCDSTKFNKSAFYNFYNCDKLTAIITDSFDFDNIREYREISNIV